GVAGPPESSPCGVGPWQSGQWESSHSSNRLAFHLLRHAHRHSSTSAHPIGIGVAAVHGWNLVGSTPVTLLGGKAPFVNPSPDEPPCRRVPRWDLQPLILVMLFTVWAAGDSAEEKLSSNCKAG